MLRSMFAAVSGLRSHQTMMDVVGNNIANVNTTGFKASRATFQEAMAQTLRGASAAGEALAGTNAMQIGLGSQVASVDGVFTQGSTQMTGRTGDLAIQGEGFFVVNKGAESFYTRAGSFNFDEAGYLATPTGARLQGWMVDETTGRINENGPVGDLQLPMGQIINPTATEKVSFAGNLPKDLEVGKSVTTSITLYDREGQARDLSVTFTRDTIAPTETDSDEWSLTVELDGNDVTPTANGLEFVQGALTVPAPVDDQNTFTLAGVLDGEDVTLNLTDLVQFGGEATAEAREQDGAAMGFLRGFEFGQDGTITGRFSNGETATLGRVALATFNNPGGLVREGESLFAGSPNSGEAIIGAPGGGDAGTLAPGALEMSNVDLAQEFTNLIIAQRGFQANSRGITASDELLQELVNLKR
jgi:flagellar hook protein FlgE